MKISEITEGTPIDKIANFIVLSDPTEAFSVRELSDKFCVPESTIKSSTKLRPFSVKYDGKLYFANDAAREALLES